MPATDDISWSTLAEILCALTAGQPEPAVVVAPAGPGGDPPPQCWATITPGAAPLPAGPPGSGPHWLAPVIRTMVAQALAAPPADQRDRSAAELVFSRLDLARFVDDLCAAPATWPVPWPVPGPDRWWPEQCLDSGALPATDLLVAAAHLQQAADRLDGAHPLRPELAAAAAGLGDAGLARLAEQAKHRAKHQAKHQANPQADPQAKHQSLAPDRRVALIMFAKHR